MIVSAQINERMGLCDKAINLPFLGTFYNVWDIQ